jgi:hypothetical protein
LSSPHSFSCPLLSFLSSNFSIIIHSFSFHFFCTSSFSHSLLILLSFLSSYSISFCSSVTLVKIYQTTRHHSLRESTVHTHRRENPTSFVLYTEILFVSHRTNTETLLVLFTEVAAV